MLHALVLIALLYPLFLLPIGYAASRGWLPALTEGSES
jgi:hypothetical protein